MDQFKIAATGISMNYMPEYLAQEMGFFKEADVEVISYAPNPWTVGLEDIDKGEADVVLGGIWVPMLYRNHIQNYDSIAKIASKCPLFIVSREPVQAQFSWRLLENKRVLVSGGDGASHYLMTLGSAKDGGADTDKIRFIHDFSTSMLCDLFEGGFGDFIVVQPNIAHEMIAKKKGYLFCDLTSKGANIPWSVYYGTREQMEKNTAGFEKFVLGLQKGTTYLLEHGGKVCRTIIEEKWPNMPVNEGIETIDMFIREGMWTPTVDIQKDELNRWQNYLVLGDILDKPLAYEELVDPSFYQKALKSLGEEGSK